MNVHCYIIVVSSQIPTYVTNSKSIMDYCKVCRTRDNILSLAVLRSQTIDLDGYYKITRLVGKG